MNFSREPFPRTKDNKCSKYAGLSYYTPRIYNSKRDYLWSMDVTHPGISSNKKQAVEAATTRPDFLQWSVYPLDNASHYHSTPGQVQGGLVSGPSQFAYMVDVPLGTGVVSVGRKDFHDACQGDASLNSHNLGEMLKAKINHVSDSENVMFAPISNLLRKVDDGRLLRSTSCNKYYGTFLSLGSACQIKDGNNTPVDVIRNEGLDLSLTLGHNYEEKRDIIVSGRTDEGSMEHASSTAVADNKAIVDYPNYAHLSGATTQTNTIEPNAHQNNIPVHAICNGGYNEHQTLHRNHKEKGNFVAFAGVKVTTDDEAMLKNRSFAQSSWATNWVGTVEPNAHPSTESNSNPGGKAKDKNAFREKKPATASEPHPNLYQLSVHSLLSTGIFDGALVKYICESRDLILHGVIKGSKILCSCNKCNNNKYIGPCKFERHAGGKTKRPNSHISFENGKTIYEVFHELRNTSEDKLFDAIQRIAGSAVNQLNFHIGKCRSNLGPLPNVLYQK